MSHKGAFEAVDKTLRDLHKNDRVMGGVTVLLAGDFRQILPVVPRGTMADEMSACLKNSVLWQDIQCLKLTTNMRVHLHGDAEAGRFASKLLEIGNGNLPLDSEQQLHHITVGIMVASAIELIDKVYPNFLQNFNNRDWLCERAILAPRNDAVNRINLDILDRIPADEKVYSSIDSTLDQDEAVHYPVENLNSLSPPGMPAHTLRLKQGSPVILLHNLDPPKLCNGTQLVVMNLHRNVIKCVIITGTSKGEKCVCAKNSTHFI